MSRKKKDYAPDNGPLTTKQVEQIKKSAPKPRTKKVIESADIAESMPVKAVKEAKKVIKKVMAKPTGPTVVVGSHLTVTTYPNGKTELKWDDEALLRDVRAALLKANSTIPATQTKPKKA